MLEMEEFNFPACDVMLTVMDSDCLIAPEYVHYVDWAWYSDRDRASGLVMFPNALSSNIQEVPPSSLP